MVILMAIFIWFLYASHLFQPVLFALAVITFSCKHVNVTNRPTSEALHLPGSFPCSLLAAPSLSSDFLTLAALDERPIKFVS